MREIIAKDIFLYEVNCLYKLVKYKGDLAETFHKGKAYFIGRGKLVLCSDSEGEVYNSLIWLKEDNEEKAKGLLIDTFKGRIGSHIIAIETLERKIELLEKGI